MQKINADAYGVAALTAIGSVVLMLIEKGVMTKEEAAQMYSDAAQIKTNKGLKYQSAPEIDAGKLLATLAVDMEIREEG